MKIRASLPSYLLNFLLVAFVVMPFICRFSLRYPDNEKYYPFWATDLFAGFYSVAELYSVKIFEINGKIYENGVDSFELRRTTDGFGFSASTSILMMGRRFEAGNDREFQKARVLFEQNYLRHDKSWVYAIYKTSWKAVDRWRHGKIIYERQLAKFTHKKQ